MKNLNILALLTFIMVFSAGCGSDEVYKLRSDYGKRRKGFEVFKKA